MSLLRLSAALLLALGGCAPDNPSHLPPGGGPDSGPPLGGKQPPPGPTRGPHEISAIHVEPGGARVWVVHGSVADVDATPTVATSHLGVYTAATGEFSDVLDTTGTLGKATLFPRNGRVLYVTRRGTDRDVFALLDAAARRPLDQRSYPGDRAAFRLSPSGRLVLSTDERDLRLHLLDTATLIDQPLPFIFTAIDFVEWAHTDDVFYVVQPEGAEAVVQRYDLRTADLAQPLPAPATIARLSGSPGPNLILSLDDRFAAFEVRRLPTQPPFEENQIALVALATGNTRFEPGLFAEPFTNDHRAVIYDGWTKLRIVDPATGTATQPVTVPCLVAITALRRHDALTTSHLGLYTPATGEFSDVLDTAGTVGKAILFPGNGRVLLVTQRGTERDVFVVLNAAARRPLDQRSYPGDRRTFRLSPSGRLVLSTDESDHRLHLLDTVTLIDQPLPSIFTAIDSVEWAHTEDVFYVVQPEGAEAVVQRYDLRTADLAQPLPAPTTIARLSGSPGPTLVLSLDDRFAAFEVSQPWGDEAEIALVTLATGNTRFVPGLIAEAFTSDHRAVIYDGFTKLRIVDPETGTATQPLTVPSGVAITALRRHDALMISSLIDGRAFLYRIADGARTPLSRPVDTRMMYERPGHDEIWEWSEFAKTLSRFNLATGYATFVATDVQNVAYRPEADDAILGRNGHWIQQLPLDTTRAPSLQTDLPDPNDAPAPYRLDDR